ncbi:hypothetical protein P154DRAFT_538886 [Amniculicola lignicola CBS 123094]|uniref:Uncharacterized protein n=1 Tax=Amniculicola lignicola CBS 123094 TaxID=1392246 RepID=A0A6A5W062_9PLEO|nr:hypothetical protein P154DRAFT_538886 [Amniculicola lignicola CBS 123094]
MCWQLSSAFRTALVEVYSICPQVVRVGRVLGGHAPPLEVSSTQATWAAATRFLHDGMRSQPTVAARCRVVPDHPDHHIDSGRAVPDAAGLVCSGPHSRRPWTEPCEGAAGPPAGGEQDAGGRGPLIATGRWIGSIRTPRPAAARLLAGEALPDRHDGASASPAHTARSGRVASAWNYISPVAAMATATTATTATTAGKGSARHISPPAGAQPRPRSHGLAATASHPLSRATTGCRLPAASRNGCLLSEDATRRAAFW